MKNGFLGAATLAAFCATSKVSAQTNGEETWFSHSTAKAAKLKSTAMVQRWLTLRLWLAQTVLYAA